MLHSLRHTHLPSERGTALVGVLLLLMMMSAIAAALGASGQTETLVSRNHQTAAQARAAAEAGINHGAQVLIDWLATWPNTYASADIAIDELLAGTATISGITWGGPNAIGGAAGISYVVELMDEDDPDRGAAYTPFLDDDDDDTNDENDDPDDDNNRTLIIRATGSAQNNSSAVLEAVIAQQYLPAIVTGGDLDISGNPSIVTAVPGGVHANGNLDISGSPTVIGTPAENGRVTATGSYDASGSLTLTGTADENVAEIEIPNVQATSYLSSADFILQGDGVITDAEGTELCDASSNQNACRSAYGWRFQSGTWDLDNDAAEGTVYVQAPVKISGGPGSAAHPVNITIIAEGSIEISGHPYLTPDDPEVLFVTDGDLKISGNPEIVSAEGRILVHEQIQISGNPVLRAQILAEDAADDDPTVTENRITGNPDITYQGIVGATLYRISGWREVR